MTDASPLHCPDCGCFSRDSWVRPYLDDYGADYGGTCSVHGEWSDGV